MENRKLLEINGLYKSFKGKNVFDDFSMSIEEDSITTIFGPSGSGKTTILNIIGLLETYDSGSVKLFGEKSPKVNSREAMLVRRKKIGYLFQNFGLIENSTIKENLDIGLQYQKLSKRAKKEEMMSALQQVGLNKALDDRVYNLSGGEQQRVAIARLLIKPAKLILADEPTGSLDHENRDYIMKKLEEMKEQGKTILIVSHDPEFEKISDYIITI
ncbi:ABC transporter ATP-binding protein [Ligilactobacillus salitolerans]|uniref:ABC transporter ATP-binding protein n=1 Tax=Ligilactobacillus salitolerans TaxID=1808352 RepID=A0A401IVI6_9LACO|nr:putative bacteriocin export ABC transporter [Ligilactobacillus salitolerans]GBG95563.1 ABC transporter ATP-binding protein [Ligilactobacillus salitolerans]